MATTIRHYDQGDVWTPQATFTVSGAPTDPTTVTVRIRNPSETITVLGPVSGATGGSGITRVSAGVFKTDIALDDSGYWYARFEGTGTAAAAEDHEAIVDPSPFYESNQLGTRALVSFSEARDYLQQQNIDTSEDLELARIINDVSDLIHQEADREFKPIGTNPQTRVFEVTPPAYSQPWYVDGVYMGVLGPEGRTIKIGDLATLTSATVLSGTDWTTTLASPTGSQVRGRPLVRKAWEPFTELEFRTDVASFAAGSLVSVTGNWGFPAVPGAIRQATLDAIAWSINRDVENYRTDMGTVGGEHAPVLMQFGGAQRILSLPPHVLAICWDYRERSVG